MVFSQDRRALQVTVSTNSLQLTKVFKWLLTSSEPPAASLTSLPQGSLLGFQQGRRKVPQGITSCPDPLAGWLYCTYRRHLDFCLQSSLMCNPGRANSFTCDLCHYFSYLMTLINSCVHHFLRCDMEPILPPWSVTRDWSTSTSFQQPLLAPCIRWLLRTPGWAPQPTRSLSRG